MKGRYIKMGGTKESWEQARKCAMEDIAKEQKDINDFGFIPNANHLRMKPKTFFQSLPKCEIVQI